MRLARAAAAALLLVACSGGDPGPTPTSESTTSEPTTPAPTTAEPTPAEPTPTATVPPVARIDAYTGGAEPFSHPTGAALHPDGTLWVLDSCNQRVVVLGLYGEEVKVIDRLDGTPLETCAEIEGSVTGFGAIEIDRRGHVFVVDTFHLRVLHLDANGELVASWGEEGEGDGQFLRPIDLVVDDERDRVLVVDDERGDIQAFDRQGSFQGIFGNTGFDGEHYLLNTGGIGLAPNGDLYVADWERDRVLRFGSDGELLGEWGEQGPLEGEFAFPADVAVSPGGLVFVTDWANHRVQVFEADGTFVSSWGSQGDGELEFDNPASITIDEHTLIYIGDNDNDRIVVFALRITPA